jgi:hypothetical protein
VFDTMDAVSQHRHVGESLRAFDRDAVRRVNPGESDA